MEAGSGAAAAREMEAEIEKAMSARVPDIKKQADKLTLEGVRRTLEKDLGLDKYSLDAHKNFIKQCVDKVFHGSDDEDISNDASDKPEANDDRLSKEGSEDAQPMSASSKMSSSADEQAVRSNETEKHPKGEKDQDSGSNISDGMIKEAIDKRASYFRKNAETLTMQGVRRTLEQDLKLAKKALDTYKSFISTELDRVLQEPANGTNKSSKKGTRKNADQKRSKASKRAREDSDTSELNDSQSEMDDSDEDARPRKRGSEKGKVMKRQKTVTKEKKMSTPKAKKVAKQDLDRSIEEQGGSSAEEDNPRSSAEEDSKKKRQPAPAYGKRIEHLRSIIKSCGMSVPPHVYRRAKQAPENKRDAQLIKELEDILEKEGLSKNPSEKEIKAVKKRKERAKELEGIDMSNIITSSRRRSTSSFIPLPKPKVVVDSDDDEDDAKDDEEIVEGGDKGNNDDAEAADDGEKETD